LGERFTDLRTALPENSQINLYVRQVSDRVSQTGENLRDYAQQAVSTVKDTGNTLGDLAQRSAQEVKQAGQDVAGQTKHVVRSGGSVTRVITDAPPNGVLQD
jgi:methyl-accepting chemotaxis protein